jgi:hypothetical protein
MISRRSVLIDLGWTAYVSRARARDNAQFVDSPREHQSKRSPGLSARA